MNIRIFALILALVPGMAICAPRDMAARVSVGRGGGQAAARMPTMTTLSSGINASLNIGKPVDKDVTAGGGDDSSSGVNPAPSTNCRDAYRECMDQFCLLDESEGHRCACSDNITSAATVLREIREIQDNASKIYNEDVEKEKLGAKADIIYAEKGDEKKSILGVWLNSSINQEEEDGIASLMSDVGIGETLFDDAHKYCKNELNACADRAEMEQALYQRQIAADCKAFGSYLDDQKRIAQENLAIAEAAVREARLAMFETTNKYNRIECFNALKACVQDQGGCGPNFENCLGADILKRRAESCAGVYDNCMAVKEEVVDDWAKAVDEILAGAQKNATNYRRQNCLSKMRVCLEDNCAVSSSAMCLTDKDIALEICNPKSVCELDNDETADDYTVLETAVRGAIGDMLLDLRHGFCEEDLGACLREKCGDNFTAPECLGVSALKLTQMCPQNMFSTCKGIDGNVFEAYASAARMRLDYRSMTGCIDRVSLVLGESCGSDMACLPSDDFVAGLSQIPADDDVTYTYATQTDDVVTFTGIEGLRAQVRDNATKAVKEFFGKIIHDPRIVMCLRDKQSDVVYEGETVAPDILGFAETVAETQAQARMLRDLELKIIELSRAQDVEKARETCLATYKVEAATAKENENYTRISSVSFEPSLRNCHVCRVQQVCETGGMSKLEGAAQGAMGGITTGASLGTMANAGWGTLIGGLAFGAGGAIAGASLAGEKTHCQEIESCEDINM